MEAQTKPSRTVDTAYLARVRELPCCVIGDRHAGPIEAHHETGAGMGLKADDKRTAPLCHKHHQDFHAGSGLFHGWPKQVRKEWQRAVIADTQRRLGAE